MSKSINKCIQRHCRSQTPFNSTQNMHVLQTSLFHKTENVDICRKEQSIYPSLPKQSLSPKKPFFVQFKFHQHKFYFFWAQTNIANTRFIIISCGIVLGHNKNPYSMFIFCFQMLSLFEGLYQVSSVYITHL